MLLRLPYGPAAAQLHCWTSLGGHLRGSLFTFCSEPRPCPSSLGNQGTTFLTQGAPAEGQL